MWTNQFKKIALNKNYQAGGYNLEPLSGMVSMTAAGTVYTGHIDNVTLAMSNPMYNANIYVTPARTYSTYSSFIALGTGNTTPSADDTNLANLLDASVLGVVSASTSEPVKNADGTYTFAEVPFGITLHMLESSTSQFMFEYSDEGRFTAEILIFVLFPLPPKEITFCDVVKYTSGSKETAPSGYTRILNSHE